MRRENSFLSRPLAYISFDMFVCQRCGNSDDRYVGYKNGSPYCRKCVSFKGKSAQRNYPFAHSATLKLKYHLSPEQKALSMQILESFKRGKNTLVHAVCGAGKTELTFEVIKYALINGKQVGFAIPRRDVVIELFGRLKAAFPHNRVIAVYGGHSDVLEGELIVLTTHQLFRYEDYFDLLVMDETDAFPFRGDDVLLAMFRRSCRGPYIMMSATSDAEMIDDCRRSGGEIIELNRRYHGHPLPVPIIANEIGILKYFFLVRKLREFIKACKPVLVFVPTIEKCEDLSAFLNKWVRGGGCVHSKREGRCEIIDDFRRGKYRYLVTTAVLERGVTIKDLQVIVFESDSDIYTKSALIQIAGRVGRKQDAPRGEVVFLADRKSAAMVGAIEAIEAKNSSVSDVLS